MTDCISYSADLETAEQKCDEAKKELENTLAELGEIWAQTITHTLAH